ncbi:MAG TPA: SgcJ/EcaC family oxidoreductase [Terriglobales bacterium]|nr:SgcJ/EcaC family oxidoreductase [Terriglobales bacterium]
MTTDEQALHDIPKQFETAWNRYDSVSLAALFAEDATFIHIFGGQLDGRAAIEASHRIIFDTIYKASHLSVILRSIRLVRPDVAVVFARMHLKFQEGNQAREIETRPTLIVVKEQAKWQIVALQNTRISEVPTAAQAAARLAT